MLRPVTLLGVLATAVVLGAGALVATADPDPPPAATTTTTSSPSAERAWQVVRRADATFRVPPPADGWTVLARDRVAYYADARGRPVAGVAGPAVLDDGWCRDRDPSNRGFVGLAHFSGPTRGLGVGEVSRVLTRRWLTGIGGSVLARHRAHVLLGDGRTGVLATAVLALRDHDVCTPPKVGLHLVSVAARARVTTLVLVRDLPPRDPAYDVVRRILMSLRAAS